MIELQPTLSAKQRVYRFLLACSRLRSFDGKGIPQRWAKAFTNLCKISLTGLMPAHAEIRIFDANSSREGGENGRGTEGKNGLKARCYEKNAQNLEILIFG